MWMQMMAHQGDAGWAAKKERNTFWSINIRCSFCLQLMS
jgi:hypothetical protein